MPSPSIVALVPVLLAGTALVGTAPVATTTPRKLAPDTPVARHARCVTDAAIRSATTYAKGRPGNVSFAVYEQGTLRSYRGGVPYRSASLVKAMLLVADLRHHAATHSALTVSDRSRLGSMIHVSDNVAATATFNLVGAPAVRGVAHMAGMRHYSVGYGWGTSQLTASDQARFWGHLDQYLPAKYRAYGRGLLRTVSQPQSWGIPTSSRHHGYRTMFKGGWLPQPSGWLVHQGARLERGPCRIGLAVLTGQGPSMGNGTETIAGVTRRLLGS